MTRRKIKERSANLYSEHPYGELTVNRSKTNKYIVDFLKSIPYKLDKKIFDIGCGTGVLSQLFCEQGFRQENIVCFDFSIPALKHVRQNGFIAVQGNVEDMPFKDKISNITISIGVIHHTTSSKNAFTEICRITKPKGLILVSVYNIWHPYFFFIYKLLTPFRYIYWNYAKWIILPISILLYPAAQIGSLIFTGQFIKKFRAIKTMVADQVFTPRCELFSASKLRNYGKNQRLTLIQEGLTLSGLMRFAIFRKES